MKAADLLRCLPSFKVMVKARPELKVLTVRQICADLTARYLEEGARFSVKTVHRWTQGHATLKVRGRKDRHNSKTATKEIRLRFDRLYARLFGVDCFIPPVTKVKVCNQHKAVPFAEGKAWGRCFIIKQGALERHILEYAPKGKDEKVKRNIEEKQGYKWVDVLDKKGRKMFDTIQVATFHADRMYSRTRRYNKEGKLYQHRSPICQDNVALSPATITIKKVRRHKVVTSKYVYVPATGDIHTLGSIERILKALSHQWVDSLHIVRNTAHGANRLPFSWRDVSADLAMSLWEYLVNDGSLKDEDIERMLSKEAKQRFLTFVRDNRKFYVLGEGELIQRAFDCFEVIRDIDIAE